MDEERKQRRAHHDAGWSSTHRAQDAINDWIEHSGVGHNPKKEDCENEHADDRRKAFETVDNKFAGVSTEATDQRRNNWN